MRLILNGPPGSGKGTQAKLLAAKFDLVHVSTGDILREAIRCKTPAGRRAEPYIVNGQFVPDDLVNDMVADLLRGDQRPERFVMDGYPRTLAQASSFDQALRQQFLDLSAVVVLKVDDQEIVRRLSGRRTCPNCQSTFHTVFKPPKVPETCDVCGTRLIQREDDQEATVRRRLNLYHQNNGEVLVHYRAQGLLHEVPGIGTIDEVFARIVSLL